MDEEGAKNVDFAYLAHLLQNRIEDLEEKFLLFMKLHPPTKEVFSKKKRSSQKKSKLSEQSPTTSLEKIFFNNIIPSSNNICFYYSHNPLKVKSLLLFLKDLLQFLRKPLMAKLKCFLLVKLML